MQYIILDLEWNGMPLYATGGYFNEIIEFGAVKLDDSLRMIDTFQALVRPKVHKKLTGRVKRLTHITNDAVRAADYFVDTYAQFRKWLGTEEKCMMSWGTGDLLVILENLRRYGMRESLSDIMDYYCDAQTVCQRVLGIDAAKQPGLSLIAEQVGVPCEDKEMHRALDDSIVTAECLRKLWNQEIFDELKARADSEFIRKITFKTTTLTNIDNPLIDKKLFRQRCPVCGSRMRRITPIAAKNKWFIADYSCSSCSDTYRGKHQFKVKYEGVAHKCVLKLIEPEDQSAENGQEVNETVVSAAE